MFQLAAQIFLGLVFGMLAKLVMPGNPPGEVIVTALLGLAGSLIGTALSYSIFGSPQVITWGFSLVGALIVLAVYRLTIGQRRADWQEFFNRHS